MPQTKQLIGYAGCILILAGCFLPFRHVQFRDVSALQGGPGIVILALGGAAAALLRARRFTGASFCAVAIVFLLALQTAMMSRLYAIWPIFWSDSSGGSGAEVSVSPVALHAHPDLGFYVIASGAFAVVAAAVYRSSRRVI